MPASRAPGARYHLPRESLLLLSRVGRAGGLAFSRRAFGSFLLLSAATLHRDRRAAVFSVICLAPLANRHAARAQLLDLEHWPSRNRSRPWLRDHVRRRLPKPRT